MTDLVQTIKQAAIDAVEAGIPARPLIGLVVGMDPLEVRVDQRLTLTERSLLFLERQRLPIMDDRLALLRFAGGQRYLVIGRLRP